MIPISKPSINTDDVEAVTRAVRSGWVSSLGTYINQFEHNFSNFLGIKESVTCSNGTVALHLALMALGIKPGDEVIVPDLTFVATVNAVLYCGAVPILVDVDRETSSIQVEDVRAAITDRTKAVIAVHLYGVPADMKGISELCKIEQLSLIEDCAEAHGATIDGKIVGSFGDVSTFSFYGNKIMTTGEGGIVSTNDTKIAQKLRHLRDHAMDPNNRYYHDQIGFNYRMTNMQAALGVSQLSRIHEFIQERKNILDKYEYYLRDIDRIELLSGTLLPGSVNWFTTILLPGRTREHRDKLIKDLAKLGIDTRPIFHTMSSLPHVNGKFFDNSEYLSACGLNLPTYVGLEESEIEIVCKGIQSVL